MKLLFRSLLVAQAAIAITSSVFAADPQVDREGYKDHPGIPRVPGFILREYGDCVETAFDAHKFWVTKDGQDVQQSVEGHMFWYRYRLKTGVPQPSALQIMRNYQNAARSAGGQVLIDKNGFTTIRLNKDGKEL